MTFLIVAGILFFVAVTSAWKYLALSSKLDTLRTGVPTSVSDARTGMPGEVVAVTGTARTDQPLVSEHTGTPCIYYSAKTERRILNSRVIAHYESRNRPSRRNQRHRYWETVSSNQRSVPFHIEDASGRVEVIPDGADFDAEEVLDRYDPNEELPSVSFAGGNITMGMGTGKRVAGHRYVEHLVPVDRQVFVLGVVNENGQIACSYDGRSDAELFVSYRSGDRLRDAWSDRAKKLFITTIALGAGAIILAFFGVNQVM